MPTSSLEFWWALIVGTTVLLILVIGIVAILFLNHRRFMRAEREKLETIRRIERTYSDIFNNVSDIVFVHSMDGKLIQINEAVTPQLGYQVNELLDKSIKEIFASEYESQIDDYLDDIQRHKESSGLFHILSKWGNVCVFEYRNSVITKDGREVAIRGIARNVTKQIDAENALRKSEIRFRDLFDNAPDIYIILNPEGTISDFNRRGLDQLGFELQDVVGKSISEIIDLRDVPKADNVLKQIHTTGEPPKSIEVRLMHNEGHAIWVSKEFSLMLDSRGELQFIRVVARDITERKKLQEDLARAQRLETAGRVAGQIAHDFNNLLAPLAAYPPLIQEDLPASHPVLEMVKEMEFAAKKIIDINQQLLSLGRRGHYSMEPIDLNDLLGKVVNSLSLPSELTVELNLAPQLSKINGGGAQLTRVLANLIINAKEAMQGIGVLTIRTENIEIAKPVIGNKAAKSGEYVKVDISDTGSGIELELLDKIFDPFFTTKKTDRLRGSGLGLSVVHGIVEDHKGYIIIDTQLGAGTTFSLYFPAVHDMETKKVRPLEQALRGDESVLVVDDDPVQRNVMDYLLSRLGYKVHTVPSGESAVEFVKRKSPDLLVLDMVMDGIDGTETYRQVLEFKPEQKAIIASGYAMSKRVEEAVRMGAMTFISKPLTPNALAKAVRAALDAERIAVTE